MTKTPIPATIATLRRKRMGVRMRKIVCCSFFISNSTLDKLHLSTPESLHNDGKGIQITASLIGLVPPPKAGEKRRANAKPPVTTKVVYVHEKITFIKGLVEIMWRQMKRKDLCKGGLDHHGKLNEKSAALFSLEYTIPRTQLKDIELSSERDWETFLSEAGKKPSAQGKLTIKEKLVSIFSRPLPSDTLISYPTSP
jgi:hypothetical protein